MSISISKKEHTLLSKLQALSGSESIATLSDELEMPEATIRSLVENLLQKGLIKREVKLQHFYQLTPEAQNYAKTALPEVRIVHLLQSYNGVSFLEDLKRVEGITESILQVGLGWARRNKWIEVSKSAEKTKLKLTKNAPKAAQSPLQQALQKTDKQGLIKYTDLGPDDATRKIVQNDLIARKLGAPFKIDKVSITITKAGTQILERLAAQEAVIGDLTPDMLKSGIWQKRRFRSYNLRGPVSRLYPGKKHPYNEFIDRLYRSLIGLGFEEAKGPLVELEFWNCDALFMPQDHVARDIHSQYHVKTPKGPGKIAYPLLLQQVAQTHENGWTTKSTGWRYNYSIDVARHLVLRSQGTAVSVRYLAEHKEFPLRMFSIDRNFRPEKVDATHAVEFLQCEGIIGGEGLTLRDLLGYLRAIAESVGITKMKFKPGFFPFTEPSVEGWVYVPELGWVEALPGGIFRPEVTLPLGIDFPVLAWGIGIGRLAMAALEIHDIRELATRNLGWLRTVSLCF